jgi:DNA invertase Pin-like site-specific DNA recombinase
MRNAEEHFAVRAALASHGVQLRSVTQPIDESASGKLVETIMAGFSAFDNDQRREKTISGMKARITHRGWPFMATIGYLKARDHHGPTLVQDPERAPHIRRAFELFATECHTKTTVLALVTRQGLRTRRAIQCQRRRSIRF